MTVKQSTVLITGSQGFTGSYLRDALLSANYVVFGIINHTEHQQPREWERCADLCDAKKLHQVIAAIQPDYVIHLAGISNVIHDNVDALYQINLHGTLNLLSVIQQAALPVKKIILASSAYIYGNHTQQKITETVCPKPMNHYAMSKLAMEYMASNLYPGLPIVIVRPFNYTGVGQKNHVLIPKIIHHFMTKSSTIHLGNLHVYREFNDVRMIAQAYCQLLTHADPGVTVNFCTGNSYCLRDILDLSTTISGHHLDVIVNPEFVRTHEAAVLSGDPKLLNTILPDLPKYTLEDTLRWMFST